MLNILDFVKAIFRTKNRPHVLMAYLSTELKNPDHLIGYITNIHVSVCLMQNCLRLLIMISVVVKKIVF